jgi:hypothetical protein
MAIIISKKGHGYIAKVTPPNGSVSNWEVTEPHDIDALVKKMLEIGCHQTDIGDALYEVDPKLIGLTKRKAT